MTAPISDPIYAAWQEAQQGTKGSPNAAVPDSAIYAAWLDAQRGVSPQDAGDQALHAEYKSGALAKRMAAENAASQAAAQPSLPEKIAAHELNVIAGIPGGEALEAAAGSLGSRVMGGPPLSYSQSLATLRGAEGAVGGKTKTAERMLGALATAPVLPENPVAAGALFGGATGALSADPNSVAARAAETALGAGAGAAGGAILGKAVPAVAQKTGLTDFLSSSLQKLGGPAADIGQAIGTPGAANEVLQGRQDILDQLQGSEKTAAQTMLDHVAAYTAKAKELYGAVEDSPAIAVVRDKWLQDPDMQSVITAAATEVGQGDPSAVSATDPRVLQLAKQMVQRSVNRGYMSAAPITRDVAVRVAPKLADFTDELHQASPELAAADQYYAQAKNFETAFQKAFGVQQRVTASGLTPGKLKSPEALNAWVAKAQGTPLGDVRAAGQQAGAAAKIAEQLRNTPIGTSAGEGLSGVLSPFNPAAAQARAAAFPNASDAQAFAQLLGEKAGEVPQPAGSAIHGYGVASIPGIPYHLLARPRFGGDLGPLATPAGSALRAGLAEMLSTAAGRQAVAERLAAAGRGNAALVPLRQALMAMFGGGAASMGGDAMQALFPDAQQPVP